MKPKVLVTRNLPEAGLAQLRERCEVEQWQSDDVIPRETLTQMLGDKDGCLTLTTERFDAEMFDAGPRLQVVANYGVGYDNLDIAEATRRGIVLTNTPDVLTDTTADFAWTLLLATARNVLPGVRYIAGDNWRTFTPSVGVGPDIHGATLGLIGLGRIGREVARRATGFRMKIIYHNRRRDPDAERACGATYYEDVDDLYRTADFISLHVPLTAETRHMVDDHAFALMKPRAVLVNTARGPVVDPDALHRALAGNRIYAAALDVTEPEPLPTDHPLLSLPNCLVTPHIASASFAAREAMCDLAARNILAVLAGERPPTPLNPIVFDRKGA